MPTARPVRPPRRSSRIATGVAVLVLALFASLAVSTSAFAQGGHEGEEEAGNNLSFPVIWAEGEGSTLTLPGAFGEAGEQFGGEFVTVDEQDWYLQGDPLNVWQAGSMAPPDDGAGGLTDVEVSTFDWGDNLEAKSWPLGKQSILRVETVLYRTLADGTAFPPMDTYPMKDVLAYDLTPPVGAREEWATTGLQAPGTEATIYTDRARVTIQRLLIDREDPAVGDVLEWDAAAGKWVGENAIDPTPVLMTAAGAEVNQSGKVIFGTNWSMNDLTDGHYRITFHFDPATTELNTFITENTVIAVSEEEGEITEAAAPPDEGGEPDMNGGIPGLDPVNNLGYIDVQLGEPTYGPYVPPETEPEPKPEPAPVTPNPGTAPPGDTSDEKPARVRKHVRMTLHRRYLPRDRVRFYGSVRPRHDGKKVRLQRRLDGRYRTVARMKLRRATKHRSRYRRTLRHVTPGAYRVVMRGDAEHLRTVIGVVRVRDR